MKFAIRMLVLLLALAPLYASALSVGGPTMGLWYNPQESGRGYDIDLQGDTMVVTTYIYEPSGDPIWYLSSGTYDHNTGVFLSSLDSYSGGQCFGCEYHAPTLASGAGGPIMIVFHTNQTATLTWAGGSIDIIKFQYGFPSKTDMLYGEWALSYENAGTIGGDWIVFDTPFTDEDGNKFVSGHAAGAPTTTALAYYDPVFREAQISVTQGNVVRLYRFGVFDDRRGIGRVMITTEGQTEVPEYTATGARLLYKGELSGGIIGGTTGAGDIAADGAAATATLRRAHAALDAVAH